MAIRLKQSTASQEIPLGYFVDSTDGNTEKTALTINNTDIKLWKMGATTLANKNSGGATHISNGIYYCTLDATDTNTLGALIVFVHVSGALAVRVECEVVPAVIYDTWIAGTDNFDVSVTQWSGSNVATVSVAGVPEVDITHINGVAVSTSTAQLGVNAVQAGGTAWGSGAITAASIADGAIDRATFAADTGLQTARSNTAQAGAAGSITLDASASATTDFYLGSWVFITGNTGVGQMRVITAYNGTTKVATIAPNWATNPDATSTFAIIPAAQVTGVQGNVTGSVGSVTGAVGSVTGAVGSVTGNVGGNVVGSVGSVTGAVGSVTGAVGSVTGNVGGNVTGSVGSLATQAKADVNAEVVDALATDTYAEAGSVPAATSTLKDKINWLFALARNKRTTTATTDTLRNDADSGNIATATVSDNGTTFTRQEWS